VADACAATAWRGQTMFPGHPSRGSCHDSDGVARDRQGGVGPRGQARDHRIVDANFVMSLLALDRS